MNVLTFVEAGERLGCSHDTVTRLVNKGAIRVVDIGTGLRPRFRIREDDLDKFIEARTNTAPAKTDSLSA